MTVADKVNIVHKVIIQGHPNKDVAREYRVTASYVSTLVQKARKKPKFLSEMVQEQLDEDANRENIRESIKAFKETCDYVDTVKEIREHIKKKHQLETKPSVVKSILRNDLRMRYKRIVPLSWQGNSTKNIILR